MDEVTYKFIGVVRSQFTDPEGMPIQPKAAIGIQGTVELKTEFVPGLKDLEGFSHIILIYHFHLSGNCSLEATPFLDDTPRGAFATRVPSRPNSIGLSVVRLKGIRGNLLDIEDVDILDGTPLLDVKPFIPELDNRETDRIGWFAGKLHALETTKADRRFCDE
jgi:tRNA (adenine37-N6)-methyltransferase